MHYLNSIYISGVLNIKDQINSSIYWLGDGCGYLISQKWMQNHSPNNALPTLNESSNQESFFGLSAQVDNMTESQFIFKLGVNNLVPKLTLSARSKNKRILLIWLVFKFQWIKHQCTCKQDFDHIFRLCHHHRHSSVCIYIWIPIPVLQINHYESDFLIYKLRRWRMNY